MKVERIDYRNGDRVIVICEEFPPLPRKWLLVRFYVEIETSNTDVPNSPFENPSFVWR